MFVNFVSGDYKLSLDHLRTNNEPPLYSVDGFADGCMESSSGDAFAYRGYRSRKWVPKRRGLPGPLPYLSSVGKCELSHYYIFSTFLLLIPGAERDSALSPERRFIRFSHLNCRFVFCALFTMAFLV
ncbi:hypothetical protein QE152_g18040 [Popillia japonica]|uniref:Uncharacterized protein n=1 Tax=Popillia japonica TaxID=7064 RepID=A0AAW1L132_POPJA